MQKRKNRIKLVDKSTTARIPNNYIHSDLLPKMTSSHPNKDTHTHEVSFGLSNKGQRYLPTLFL